MINEKNPTLTSKFWYNINPFLREELGFEIPNMIASKTGEPALVSDLDKILPRELALQELSEGIYSEIDKVKIPEQVFQQYSCFRPTPLVRAHGIERNLELKHAKIYYKREDLSPIGSYKLNSALAQAYYAKMQGLNELVVETGPGNWGIAMALAGKIFKISITIYMEDSNYQSRKDKVSVMKSFGAKVRSIKCSSETLAASLSTAVEYVFKNPNSRLSLGCLSNYSALHNTVIGLELGEQLKALNIIPTEILGIVGGGSSFSGLVFPLIKDYIRQTKFTAVESASVPSFTKGDYRYENPDLLNLMPLIKMYTLGNTFVPNCKTASGINYHGKNSLLSLLVNKKIINTLVSEEIDAKNAGDTFLKCEGIKPAPESCYAIDGIIKSSLCNDFRDAVFVFALTGNSTSLEN